MLKEAFQRLLNNKPKKIVKWLDYRIQRWGHALKLDATGKTIKDTPEYRGHIFSGKALLTGDIILMSGQAYAALPLIITKVEPCGDPHDMYYINCYPPSKIDFENVTNGTELRQILIDAGIMEVKT